MGRVQLIHDELPNGEKVDREVELGAAEYGKLLDKDEQYWIDFYGCKEVGLNRME